MDSDEGRGWLRWTASIVTSTALGIGLMTLAGSALHETRVHALLDGSPAAHVKADGLRCLAPTMTRAG